MVSPEQDPIVVDSHLPLRPVEFQILISLVGEARHGYRILQDAEERAAGVVPGLATLYRALKRLDEAGLTCEAPAPPEETDQRRRYFALTPLGRAVAGAEAVRLRGLIREAVDARLIDAETGTT